MSSTNITLTLVELFRKIMPDADASKTVSTIEELVLDKAKTSLEQTNKVVDTKLEQVTTKEKAADLRAEFKGDVSGLRVEMKDLKTELKEDIAGLKGDIASLRTELKGDIADVRGEMKDMKIDIIKWTFGLLVAQMGIILGVVYYIIKALQNN